MALPPEQFHIKRRREEEPVETLYIQSELHQKKRRFTDFIFQRVQVGTDAVATAEDAAPPSPSTLSTPGQGRVRSPRSVSTSFFPKRVSNRNEAAAGSGSGIPTVRATSPGAEFREERALAAARRQQEDARSKRLTESIDMLQQQEKQIPIESTPSKSLPTTQSSSQKSLASPSFPTSLRRFHISRPNTPANPLRTATGSGIAKSNTSARARAVLVEKLTQPPSLRGASILETLQRAEKPAEEIDTVVQSQLQVREEEAHRPRKRPVVNAAEKKWREQQKDSISAAKQHLASTTVESADYLDKLAKDLEKVMLDIDAEETQMDFTPSPQQPTKTVAVSPLKYKPRHHPSPRKAPDEEMDGEYVYDTYIRVPVRPPTDMDGLTDPLTDAMPSTPHGIDPTRKDVGVVVITEEDEKLWEDFLENEDEEGENWDGEDVDSNAEDNPANDYPDEDLSSADEQNDPSAIYRRYRYGGSDDEEFDVNRYDEDEQASDEEHDYGYGTGVMDDEKTLGRARRLQGLYNRQHRIEGLSGEDDEE
ncbi:hypothetical protein BGW36DRAFT_397721 [Talaromyces proteolyticus]|uniref:Transcription factor Iwr1 domain-containing protein n=1 Tax=Talaromyces proteolyticus TaxID=1131652 RepID=A0AAD4KNZ3_9EURO|nr:uncharacterized protein BGW36DRAFT_397721 [Talaromyces proteolyticus]KAH8696085.1 hypothetical protein BGW36DRAFT_397721 [Talaromyces proteolyticus]